MANQTDTLAQVAILEVQRDMRRNQRTLANVWSQCTSNVEGSFERASVDWVERRRRNGSTTQAVLRKHTINTCTQQSMPLVFQLSWNQMSRQGLSL